mgnify:CR=1 FL=1
MNTQQALTAIITPTNIFHLDLIARPSPVRIDTDPSDSETSNSESSSTDSESYIDLLDDDSDYIYEKISEWSEELYRNNKR